jgi:glycosyltransferase involved in cell wall biosynthesis
MRSSTGMQDASDDALSLADSGPFISVVMPIYNREAFVAEAIESVLAQTYRHWELILVDDGCSDSSMNIAQSYALRFPDKIRCVAHEDGDNHGVSASRNLGSRHGKGSHIASLDSDDLWLPEKLELQVSILRRFPNVALIVGATKYWYPDDNTRDIVISAGGPRDRLLEPPELFRAMYPIGTGVAPSMNTILLRADVIARVGGWEDQFRTTYEDQALLCKIYLSETVYISSEIYDLYRQHATSISSKELIGVRYFRSRYIFLQWLERWLTTERPEHTVELKSVQNALRAPELRPYRGPIRYNLWRVWQKLKRFVKS